jgi:hypothetical protein
MGNEYAPQQGPITGPGFPGVLPAKGWVPSPSPVLNLIGVYDAKKQLWVGLPQEALTEALAPAEKQHALDRIDSRNGRCGVTVPIGTAVGAAVTDEIEVPAGEIWYLRNHEIRIAQAAGLTAGDLICNFRVSRFPKLNDVDKAFYSTEDRLTATQAQIAAGDITDHRSIIWRDAIGDVVQKREVLRDFADPDELGNALRLVGGDKLTLVVVVDDDAVAGSAVSVTLTVWGLRGKRLVE